MLPRLGYLFIRVHVPEIGYKGLKQHTKFIGIFAWPSFVFRPNLLVVLPFMVSFSVNLGCKIFSLLNGLSVVSLLEFPPCICRSFCCDGRQFVVV